MRPLAVAVLGLALFAGAATAEAPGAEASLKRMLAALESASFDAFVADGEAGFREALKKTTFDAVSAQMAPRLKGGHAATYLGTLNQVGYAVHLWKLVFKDGKDDVLARISTKDGRVGGFFLQ